jgi:hypothetical protein
MFENPTANLTALLNSCAKIECFSSDLIFKFLRVGRRIQNASEQFVLAINLRFSSNPTNKIVTELGLEIQTAFSR